MARWFWYILATLALLALGAAGMFTYLIHGLTWMG